MPPSPVYLITAHEGQPACPSPSTQPVRGDTQVESSHQVVTALGAIRTEGLPVALAEPAIHAAISVMATVAIAPSLRLTVLKQAV